MGAPLSSSLTLTFHFSLCDLPPPASIPSWIDSQMEVQVSAEGRGEGDAQQVDGSDEIVDGRPRRALPVGVKLFADEACVVSPLLSL